MKQKMNRRKALKCLAAMASAAMIDREMAAKDSNPLEGQKQSKDPFAEIGPYPDNVLPSGVRSRFVDNINGLRMHVLEAGYEGDNRPGVLLLHGFPELAYSWRRVMVQLAENGFHVMAPDQRGYGRTTGWNRDYDGDLGSFRLLNLARDALGLVYVFGHIKVAVVGHDFGSAVAGWCAMTRPDVFTSVALMSAPFSGPGNLPFDTADNPPPPSPKESLYEDLAKLPRPRKHYQRYYWTREANENMWRAPQGLHAFLRAYYHYKSTDWTGKKPYRLASRTAAEMAKMPTYYIMDKEDGMAETVAKHMPSTSAIAANDWLPDNELQVYTEEYSRNGFQGGLNWYRATVLGNAEKQLFAGRKIEQPSVFISGASDWGSYQNPGALERMQTKVCTNMQAVHMVEGAGHWVQQEQSEKTGQLLVDFLNS